MNTILQETTGGSVLVGNIDQPDEWLIKLTGLIRSGYTIGYYPANEEFDGRFRQIRVELSESAKTKAGKLTSRTEKAIERYGLHPSLVSGNKE